MNEHFLRKAFLIVLTGDINSINLFVVLTEDINCTGVVEEEEEEEKEEKEEEEVDGEEDKELEVEKEVELGDKY